MINRQHFQSIRYKLFASVLLITVSALIISGIAMIAFDLRDYRQRLIEDLTTQCNLLGLANVSALQFDDPKSATESLSTLAARPQILAAAIYDAHGALFANYASAGGKDTDAFPPTVRTDEPKIKGRSLILWQTIIDRKEVVGALYIKADYPIYARVWQYTRIVLSAMVLALLIAMVLSFRIQRGVTTPILNIAKLAQRITQERDYHLRAEKTTNDEIGHLVDAFNNLLSEVDARTAALELSSQHLREEIGERKKIDEARLRATNEVRRLNLELEKRVEARTSELERANNELEAFSYSVSHDLRTPLRAIDGFSQALLEDYGQNLDATGHDYLARVRAGAQRMGTLIDDLLKLAHVSRATLNRESIDLSAIADEIVADLRVSDPQRKVDITIIPELMALGDPHLLRIVLENLFSNAWKYSGKRTRANIEFGLSQHNGGTAYFVRDNGAGFDMAYANKLFGAFQRLHDAKEFPGTGVGLATVQRIIHRHGGHIWAEAVIDKGSTFYFTLRTTKELQNG